MRKTGILTLVLVIIAGAFGCGGAERAASLTANTTAASVVTDNVSEPSFGDAEARATATNAAAASNTAVRPVEQQRRRLGQVLAEKASLAQTGAAQVDTAPSDRKIIRNADLSLESETPEETQRRITSIAEANGGFVVESQQTSSDVRATKRDIVTMSVRVPSQKFADTLEQIRATSEKIIFETVKGDDVTEEFIDIEARLKAKKALEQQFVEIMKRAYSIDDALSVQSQLADVRGEIEKIEGRMRFLQNQSSLSTIKIKLQTPAVFSASSSGFSNRLGQSFGTGLNFALDFLLGLVMVVVAILPIAVIFGLPGFLIVRYLLKRQSRPRSVVEIAKDELNAT